MEHAIYPYPVKKDRGSETYVITAHGSSFKPFLPVEQEPTDIDMGDIEFYTLVEDSYELLSGNLAIGLAAGKIRDDICEQRAKLYRKLITYPDMILDIDREDRFIAGIYKCKGFMPIINFNDMPNKLINGIKYKSSLSETIAMIRGYHINSSESHKKIKIVAAFCLSGLPKELDVIEDMLKGLDLNEKSKSASIGSISELSSLLLKKRSKSKLGRSKNKWAPKKTIKKKEKKKKGLTKKGPKKGLIKKGSKKKGSKKKGSKKKGSKETGSKKKGSIKRG